MFVILMKIIISQYPFSLAPSPIQNQGKGENCTRQMLNRTPSRWKITSEQIVMMCK